MDYLKIEQSSDDPLITACQTRLLELIWERNALPRRGRILDIGPGKGLYTKLFLQWGMKVSCVDIDSSLRDFYIGLGCDFEKVDLRSETLPHGDETFDAIWCSHVIEHLRDPVAFLAECNRVLRPGGHLVLRTPDVKKMGFDFWDDPTHVQPYTLMSLGNILVLAGFRLIHCGNCELPGIRGLHRIRAFQWWPSLLFKGGNLLAVAQKEGQTP
jgi:2-polyprenyl-3-methyl-5-hydroxy-6-metoxy-1,4-benzoquinol methylase